MTKRETAELPGGGIWPLEDTEKREDGRTKNWVAKKVDQSGGGKSDQPPKTIRGGGQQKRPLTQRPAEQTR